MVINSNPLAIVLIEISSYGASNDTLVHMDKGKEHDGLKHDAINKVNKYKGTIMQDFGDTLLAAFASPDAALDASCEILKACIPDSVDSSDNFVGVMASVGIAYGSMHVDKGFMSSEAVAHATTLLDATNAGEILVDYNFHQALSCDGAYKFEKPAQVINEECWKLICEGLGDFKPVIKMDVESVVVASSGEYKETPIHLRYKDQSYTLPVGAPRFTIGRAQDNDIVIGSWSYVSRYHARVERTENGIALVNLSGNGCCFKPEGGVAQGCLDSQLLTEKGVIGLAPDFNFSHDNLIEYEIG